MTRRDETGGDTEAGNPRRQVVAKTIGELRTFIDEIANGTANYRTVHSLTEQIEHQYHDRFAIELLQNAHDALLAAPAGQSRRIAFCIDASSAPHGALLVANDGVPFRRKNFLALARLGQSSKDFRESVGNKGLGFRSVLEICSAPEIYSRSDLASAEFDGFSFRFSPASLAGFGELLRRLLNGDDAVVWDFDGECFALGQLCIADFRSACLANDIDPVAEFRLLSPYLLPLPATATDPSVLEFAQSGYSTVVRLPFDSPESREKAVARLAELTPDTLLFLDGLDTLLVNDGASPPRVLRRTQELGPGSRALVTITDHDAEPAQAGRFWVWQRTVGGPDDPEGAIALRCAVRELPGRWPEMTEATISLAVVAGESPLPGHYFIYLPTCLPTGSSAHLNAPFYGDISRTEVEFAEPLNELLRKRLADLAVNVIREELAGGSPEGAAAILDLLVDQDGDVDDDWIALVKPGLVDLRLFRTDRGWKTAATARVVPALTDALVLTEAALRHHAAFDAVDSALGPRARQVRAALQAFDGVVAPTTEECAATVEAVAAQRDIAWERFWIEVEQLLPDARALRGRSVLLDTEGVLRAADSDVRVFFTPPRRAAVSAAQPEEDAPGGVTIPVPDSLADRVAFLSQDIPLRRRNPSGRIENTPTRKYLEAIVDEYAVGTIIRSVLIPALPTGAVALEGKDGRRCQDILAFAVLLVSGAREDTSLVPLLSRLRLPCRGGWFPASEAAFGPGWPGTVGSQLLTYLEAADTADARALADRLLVPPGSQYLSGYEADVRGWLEVPIGVIDGLRPNTVHLRPFPVGVLRL